MSAHNTESAPPPPFNPDELKALVDRIGAALKEALGAPLPELPLRLQGIIGMVLVRMGIEVLLQAGASKAAVLGKVGLWVSAYKCPCPECEAQRAHARCTTKGGSA